MRNTVFAIFSIVVLLSVECQQRAQAKLPVIHDHDISPLYGAWENAMGPTGYPMTIGPRWWTSLNGSCPQRSRYKVISISNEIVGGEASINIVIHLFGAKYIGIKALHSCEMRMLANDAFTEITLTDEGSEEHAPILSFIWRSCDTLENLMRPVDPNHLDIKSCGAGGGIMDRLIGKQ